MCKLYTPEVLQIRASCLSACLGCFFFSFAEAHSGLLFISSRIEYFAVFMVCIEKERAAADLHIGDLVPNHSVYCVWTGHTSVVTGCCSATCTTVQHLVKCRAKLLFSISPLNRSLSLSIHFALHSSLRRLLFIRHFTHSPVSLLSILPIKFLLTPIGRTLCSGPSRYCSHLHKLPVYLIIFQSFRMLCECVLAL